jgi:hypothetical protein
VKLFPYEQLTLRASNPPEEVAARLAKMVAVKQGLWRRPPEPLCGSIRGRHFKVVRILTAARNSWQPVVIGEIAPTLEGTEVWVRMRLQRVVAALTALWFGGLLCAATLLAWGGFRGGFRPATRNGPAFGLAFAVGMILLGYLLVSVAFWTEAKKARSLLCEGLGCREVKRSNRLVRTR